VLVLGVQVRLAAVPPVPATEVGGRSEPVASDAFETAES
jgi:hypothetical protein